jgi:aspartyl-tRNA(Asn)/glutamyl-tRNA(Gln) amidotransferase subunit A
MSDDILNLSLIEVRDRIASGALTSVEVTQAAIDQAKRFDDSHNLFITFTPEAALEQAAAIDAAREASELLGPLAGVPITIKDNVDVAGVPGTGATIVLKDRIPAEDATVVANLKGAGAVILGKVNMHEMALGGTSINPHYGPVGNPWDLERIAGGSSGASAACVSLRIGYASLGTDAGGSVRIPSCCCGVVGLKQTHGVVSLHGGLPTTTQHVDHIGPHTRNVADARAMLEVMAGYDEKDVHSTAHPLEPAEPLADLSGLTVGLPETYFWEDLDPEVEASCRDVVAKLIDLGATVKPIDLDVGQYMPLMQSAMLAEAYVFHEPLLKESGHLYSDDLRYRILAGQYVLAQDYIRAQRVRRLLIEAVADAFADIDLMAMPTLPIPAMKIADVRGWENTRALVHNTSPFNQTGLPAITLPVATTAEGTPIGFQLVAKAFEDYKLLAAAEVVEQAVAFDTMPPVLREALAV